MLQQASRSACEAGECFRCYLNGQKSVCMQHLLAANARIDQLGIKSSPHGELTCIGLPARSCMLVPLLAEVGALQAAQHRRIQRRTSQVTDTATGHRILHGAAAALQEKVLHPRAFRQPPDQ